MVLKITNTGTQINQELFDYINQKFDGIYFNQISITFHNFEDDNQEIELSEKVVNIVYPNEQLFLNNTICLMEEELNQNIVDWLKTL